MKPPLRVEQAMLAALEEAIAEPSTTWHGISTDVIKRNAVELLAKKGLVELNQETGQFKLLKK
jgi:hypothetical protein